MVYTVIDSKVGLTLLTLLPKADSAIHSFAHLLSRLTKIDDPVKFHSVKNSTPDLPIFNTLLIAFNPIDVKMVWPTRLTNQLAQY